MEPQPISPQPVQPVSPTRPRGPMIAAIIVGILVLAGAVFAYTKLVNPSVTVVSPTSTPSVSTSATPTAITDWKTYTSTKYGFEIKYPAGFKAEIVSEKEIKILPSALSPSSSTDHLTLTIGPDTFEQVRERNSGAGPCAEAEDITFGSQKIPALKVNCGDGPWSTSDIFLTLDSKTLLELSTSMSSEEGNESVAREVFDQILSAFKFTSSSIPSSWKTYTNTQYGYTVKYPATWNPADCSARSANNCQGFLAKGGNGFDFAIQENQFATLAEIKTACQQATQDGQSNCLSYKEEQVIFGGTPWWKITENHRPDLTGRDTTTTVYWTSHNNNTFFVQPFSDTELQILSTFQFTK